MDEGRARRRHQVFAYSSVSDSPPTLKTMRWFDFQWWANNATYMYVSCNINVTLINLVKTKIKAMPVLLGYLGQWWKIYIRITPKVPTCPFPGNSNPHILRAIHCWLSPILELHYNKILLANICIKLLSFLMMRAGSPFLFIEYYIVWIE